MTKPSAAGCVSNKSSDGDSDFALPRPPRLGRRRGAALGSTTSTSTSAHSDALATTAVVTPSATLASLSVTAVSTNCSPAAAKFTTLSVGSEGEGAEAVTAAAAGGCMETVISSGVCTSTGCDFTDSGARSTRITKGSALLSYIADEVVTEACVFEE